MTDDTPTDDDSTDGRGHRKVAPPIKITRHSAGLTVQLVFGMFILLTDSQVVVASILKDPEG